MITVMLKRITQRGFILALVFTFTQTGFAKEVTGEVSAVTKDSISIVYKEDEAAGIEYEILLPIDEATKVERIKNLSQIKAGDTVTVEYEDTVDTDIEGKEITKRLTKTIKFVKPAPTSPPEAIQPEEELVSLESN